MPQEGSQSEQMSQQLETRSSKWPKIWKHASHGTTEEEEEEYTMFHLTSKEKESCRVELKLNRVHTSMEVDTGTAASIINEETYKRISEGNQVKNRPQLETAKVKLRTYTGELVKVVGTLNVIVKYEKKEVELQTLVVEGCGPNLLGRDWLRVLTLNWKELFKLQLDKNNQESPLGGLIDKYSEVFEEGLGTFKGPKVKIHMDPEARPVDAHSKWIEAFPMNTSTSSATIEKLIIAFATHGLPEIVVTDNGSHFVSREFEDFLKQNGICHIRTAPYQPASNGMAERAVQTFKVGMKKMNEGSVETCISQFLTRYRITPQTSTGVSLAELLLGRKPRSRLDLVYPEIGRKVRQSQPSQKLAHDWHAKERTMKEGEAVYASNFRSGPKWMPGVLKQSAGPTSFLVQLEDG